eukprot:g27734.t1
MSDDDGEKVQEVHKIDHKYVGLVIGKDGSTIKSFKNQSGASIEIDQTLPPGMPRMVIYRGTKKQVANAVKLVDGLVLRAKEDEKTANAAGTSRRDKDEKGQPDGRRNCVPPRKRPRFTTTSEIEAAPSGSLTGLTSAMRPAWMRPKEQEEKFQDKCVWSEQKYSRGLLLQAKQKILKMKAYEVPEEMMTMTTGPRPKHRPEKDGDDHEDEEERKERKRKAREAKEAARAEHQPEEAPKEPEAKHEAKPQPSAVTSSYRNLPAGESVEPLQAEKLNKKEAYLEELRLFESFVNEGDLET